MATQERYAVHLRIPPSLAAWFGKRAKKANLSRNQLMERWLQVLADISKDYDGFLNKEYDAPHDVRERIGDHVMYLLASMNIETQVMRHTIDHIEAENRRLMKEIEGDRRERKVRVRDEQ